MSATTAGRHTHGDTATSSMAARAAAGAVSGMVAGVVFAMLAMAYAVVMGMGLWAPPRMIATIAGFEMGSAFAAGAVVAGLAIHMVLSAMYGAAFAAVAARLDRTVLLMAGVLFGLALYMVNFHVMTQFEQFAAFRMMTGNWFEIVIHGVYGVLLAAGIAAWRSRHTVRH